MQPDSELEKNIHPPSSPKNGVWDTIRFVLISVLLVLAFRYFIAQPFIVSGDSMVPTFQNSDYLIVDEISYRFQKPERGDVIIMRYPVDPSKFFIKRIVGLPGETLTIQGSSITITTIGDKRIILSEPYVKHPSNDDITVTLSGDEYYVLGDNRKASSDSRRWGPLPESDIIGKPIVRLFPLSRLAWTPGANVLSP